MTGYKVLIGRPHAKTSLVVIAVATYAIGSYREDAIAIESEAGDSLT